MNYKMWYHMLPTVKKHMIENVANTNNSKQKIMKVLLDVPSNTDFWMSDRSERFANLLNTYLKKEHMYGKNY